MASPLAALAALPPALMTQGGSDGAGSSGTCTTAPPGPAAAASVPAAAVMPPAPSPQPRVSGVGNLRRGGRTGDLSGLRGRFPAEVNGCSASVQDAVHDGGDASQVSLPRSRGEAAASTPLPLPPAAATSIAPVAGPASSAQLPETAAAVPSTRPRPYAALTRSASRACSLSRRRRAVLADPAPRRHPLPSTLSEPTCTLRASGAG